ncbi:hypothetical protein JCM17844_22200 [Iodidimonas gelatinilytica]|uniref:Cell division protein FtsQ n=1 Tax=Iodidimonas gelatinilytica TaxID=1236966 RepID=A0A5A7MTH1_9PROT|nr:cell division protein FtsQ/DivIB [Iodidimonas gelatinilytica]GEQ98583.1 hypothetical protein JCM17844_22200 [Iodidimonas gelatinilytica]GER01781.1 hypothetical protein JCM17845_24040 [Iodidimonas gelatinilytica]
MIGPFSRTGMIKAVAALVLLAVGLGAFGLYGTALRSQWALFSSEARQKLGLTVHSVDVEGAVFTSDAALNEAIGDQRGRAMDAVALDAIKARVEAISWVKSAEVERQLPDRILIRLTERTPFALWQKDRVLSLVDDTGEILTHEDLARWRHLPLIVGAGAPEAAQAMLHVLDTTPDLASQVDALVRVGARRWDVKMANNILVRLPADGPENGPESGLGEEVRAEGEPAWDCAKAWAFFAALEKQHRLMTRDIALVDLRLAERLVVRLTPEGRALGLSNGDIL